MGIRELPRIARNRPRGAKFKFDRTQVLAPSPKIFGNTVEEWMRRAPGKRNPPLPRPPFGCLFPGIDQQLGQGETAALRRSPRFTGIREIWGRPAGNGLQLGQIPGPEITNR